LLLLLDQEGICASSGSAYLADSDESSHVVKAMKADSTASCEMVRLSLGSWNPIQEVKAAVASIQKSVTALRA
jgi:cysteine desulfurase